MIRESFGCLGRLQYLGHLYNPSRRTSRNENELGRRRRPAGNPLSIAGTPGRFHFTQKSVPEDVTGRLPPVQNNNWPMLTPAEPVGHPPDVSAIFTGACPEYRVIAQGRLVLLLPSVLHVPSLYICRWVLGLLRRLLLSSARNSESSSRTETLPGQADR